MGNGEKSENGLPGAAAGAFQQALGGEMSQLGVDLGSGGDGELPQVLPTVNLDWPVGRILARELGQFLSRCGIFRQGDRIVTVDELSGSVEPMTNERFCSWAEKWVRTVKASKDGPRDVTMSKDLAGKILAADQFRDVLRSLSGVHPVRMPVWRDGKRRVELLPVGYDEETGIFTVESLRYDAKMELPEAEKVLEELLSEYPWGDIDQGGLRRNRSVAVQVGAILGTYCRGMFPPGSKRPMLCYLANQPGTGKSTLVAMALAPVFGHASAADKPPSEERFADLLHTTAQSFQPYLFLDDIGRGIFSNALNRFLTASRHTGRKFHSNSDVFEVPAVTQVFTTGNGIELTPDLARRSLVVDLFLADEVQGRTFSQVITEDWLASEETRKRVLAACWAVVRRWSENGCKRAENCLATFEEWTGVIGALVRTAGFADPLQAPDLPMGGDAQGRAWRLFLSRLAGDEIMPGEEERVFTVKECLAKAEELEAEDVLGLEDLVGQAKDVGKAFGVRIKPWRGRKILDSRGRVVEFGKRRQNKSRGYECSVLSEPEG